MAVYKVPQDVEAEDKLLGPFSFKQFIFLIIATMGGGIAYALFKVMPPLAIIPTPIILFFAALALPLRKDQPMEVYLAAIISFIMKPKIRLWEPDGIESLVEVVAPNVDNTRLDKDYSKAEISTRLSYLANLVDSGGWSVRGVTTPGGSLQDDFYNEAQTANDFLDESGARFQSIDQLLTQSDDQRRQQIMAQMQQPAQAMPQTAFVQPQPIITQPQPQEQLQPFTPIEPIPTPTPPTSQILPTPVNTSPDPYQGLMVSPPYTPMSAVQPTAPDEDIKLVVNPYPAMNQAVISPLNDDTAMNDTGIGPATSNFTPQTPVTPIPAPVPTPVSPDTSTKASGPANNTPPEPSKEAVSPAIIDLARNHDGLSIETLGREANRIKKRELESSEEVIISLR